MGRQSKAAWWAMAACMIACGAALADDAATGLVHLQVTQPRTESAGPVDMEFTETDRTDNASMVTVRYVAGGSVVSAMWILRGMCAVTRARGKSAFRTERLPAPPGRFKITFVTSDPADPPTAPASGADRVITLHECGMLHF